VGSGSGHHSHVSAQTPERRAGQLAMASGAFFTTGQIRYPSERRSLEFSTQKVPRKTLLLLRSYIVACGGREVSEEAPMRCALAG